MTFRIQGQEQLGALSPDTCYLALVGERVKFHGSPSVEVPTSRRPLDCVAAVDIDPAAASVTFKSAGFAVLRLSRPGAQVQLTFVVMPPEALDAPAMAKVPAGKRRDVLRSVVARDVTRQSLAAALAERPDAMCGALVGKPRGDGISLQRYGAAYAVTDPRVA
jgi:hypothetical protein